MDFSQVFQTLSMFMFVIFIFYGQKIQLFTILGQIKKKMVRLAFVRDASFQALRVHVGQHVNMTPEQETRLKSLITSIAIPPVSHLDPAGLVPKMENIFKTYDRYLKANLTRIVGGVGQASLENLTNSLEVAIELDMFYRIVDHFYRMAKKMGFMMAFQLAMILPILMEMAEALFSASGHFQSGQPIGDGYGPMVAAKLAGDAKDVSEDSETSVYAVGFEERKVIVVKAKGPGGSVGNPGKVTENVINEFKPSIVVTVDAGLRMESETTGDLAEGVGVAMGGPGMDRFHIEESLAKFSIPVYTVVCKMSLKEAISAMPEAVKKQVEVGFKKVLDMIREYSKSGDTVVVVGVGNTMGIQ